MYYKDDPSTIQDLFTSIAEPYDRTNAVMSMGLHKYWNWQLVKSTFVPAQEGPLLDLCCGTGEIAYTYLKNKPNHRELYLIDFCEAMLLQAKKRAEKGGFQQHNTLNFIQADAQKLPLENSSVSAVSIAYGIRNIREPLVCLKEVYRVLKKDAICGILELTRPPQKVLRKLHQIYLKMMIPVLGRLCTSNKEAYAYLRDSVGYFMEPLELASLMAQVGFKEIKVQPLTWGAAHLLVGKKGA